MAGGEHRQAARHRLEDDGGRALLVAGGRDLARGDEEVGGAHRGGDLRRRERAAEVDVGAAGGAGLGLERAAAEDVEAHAGHVAHRLEQVEDPLLLDQAADEQEPELGVPLAGDEREALERDTEVVDLDTCGVGTERDQVGAHVLAQREQDGVAAEQPLEHPRAVAAPLARERGGVVAVERDDHRHDARDGRGVVRGVVAEVRVHELDPALADDRAQRSPGGGREDLHAGELAGDAAPGRPVARLEVLEVVPLVPRIGQDGARNHHRSHALQMPERLRDEGLGERQELPYEMADYWRW